MHLSRLHLLARQTLHLQLQVIWSRPLRSRRLLHLLRAPIYHSLPTTELRRLVVVGHSVLGKHLVLRMVLWLMMLLLRPQMLLVKRIEALSAAVMDFLYMRNKNALFGMALGMGCIVDIRIVAWIVAGTV